MSANMRVLDFIYYKNKVCGVGLRAFLLLSFITIVFLAQNVRPSFSANGSIVYTYDALGRIASASYDTGVIVIYAYDANGNRTSQTVNVNTVPAVWGQFNWGQALWQ